MCCVVVWFCCCCFFYSICLYQQFFSICFFPVIWLQFCLCISLLHLQTKHIHIHRERLPSVRSARIVLYLTFTDVPFGRRKNCKHGFISISSFMPLTLRANRFFFVSVSCLVILCCDLSCFFCDFK